jgi:type IV pilus assembly protein PilV
MQLGVSLIEVLIAVVLISISFLASARMQVEGMRFSQSAYHQSQAYFMANDMIDRMRSNLPGVELGHYTGAKTSASASDPGCLVIQCNPLGIARQDLHDWSTYLHPLQTTGEFTPVLPGTDTSPALGEVLAVADGVFAVVIRWNEVIRGENAEQNLRIQFALEGSV